MYRIIRMEVVTGQWHWPALEYQILERPRVSARYGGYVGLEPLRNHLVLSTQILVYAAPVPTPAFLLKSVITSFFELRAFFFSCV